MGPVRARFPRGEKRESFPPECVHAASIFCKVPIHLDGAASSSFIDQARSSSIRHEKRLFMMQRLHTRMPSRNLIRLVHLFPQSNASNGNIYFHRPPSLYPATMCRMAWPWGLKLSVRVICFNRPLLPPCHEGCQLRLFRRRRACDGSLIRNDVGLTRVGAHSCWWRRLLPDSMRLRCFI